MNRFVFSGDSPDILLGLISARIHDVKLLRPRFTSTNRRPHRRIIVYSNGKRLAPLSELDRDVLRLAKLYSPPAEFMACLKALHLSPMQFFQRLNALADSPAAKAYDSVLVARLRRMRQRRDWR